MYLCLTITIDRARSTLLVTVNTFRACVYSAATVGKLSYLVIVLMGHMMVVNIQLYFITRWLTRDIGYFRILQFVQSIFLIGQATTRCTPSHFMYSCI